MDFWNNILRYPRFFLSSMLGLVLVLTTPLARLLNEVANKKVLLLLFLGIVISFMLILNLMINPD